ncbi:hypothetical protein [Caldithrix abyssi]|uniref:hypothetical protein n=1 Tax=Caldithrix abyssi TaxID=187145 RepID=UPI0005C4C3DA|nr:hypothetical protein [Caldithrix abyssi]
MDYNLKFIPPVRYACPELNRRGVVKRAIKEWETFFGIAEAFLLCHFDEPVPRARRNFLKKWRGKTVRAKDFPEKFALASSNLGTSKTNIN